MKKTCTRCKTEKPTDHFVVRRASKDGLAPTCKPCDSAYKKEYRKIKNPATLGHG